ncbi:LytR/AlgR family response regulator transcription factor [Sporomusa malonica]|uniref:Two component transcriptional regulator, LytTR family n=1 Tax=Sporomusa malonica TaxID=112901 RepID=A0A1W2BAN5_9FIRM|nr:LytTR family DNA-binding domain-containing protein [Sporomusa malonica]SMC69782.1 two component transcriptional regulator, LytTR family [Sporomusa malonica]
MLQVVLVDDERCVLEELAYRLEGQVEIIGKFTSSFAALERLETLSPDAVFLDIEMPGLNGLETAAEIMSLLPATAIIFVTAYSHYAVKAFELNAIDYLVKPVQPERLSKTLERLAHRLADGQNAIEEKKLKAFLKTSLAASCSEKIVLWQGKSMEIIAMESIAGCFVTKGERTVRVMAGGNIYHTHGSLHDFVEKIQTGLLLRCHRSHYLNPRLLVRLKQKEDKTMNAYLEGYPEALPVSRAYRHSVLKSFNGRAPIEEPSYSEEKKQ